MPRERELSHARLKQLAEYAGWQRVSAKDSAALGRKLMTLVKKYTKFTMEKAASEARRCKRKTVTAGDVMQAMYEYLGLKRMACKKSRAAAMDYLSQTAPSMYLVSRAVLEKEMRKHIGKLKLSGDALALFSQEVDTALISILREAKSMVRGKRITLQLGDVNNKIVRVAELMALK